jgi:Apea-like HEPN
VKNPKLHSVMKRYVLTGVALVRDRCQPEREEEQQWVRSEAGYWLEPVTRLAWERCLRQQSITDELHALPEYELLVTVLRADPLIAPQIDSLVGTLGWAGRLELDHLTDTVIVACLLRSPSDTEDQRTFETYYTELEARLYADEFHHEELFFLAGFTSEVLPLRLRQGVEIVEVTPEQARMALRIGLFPSMEVAGHTVVHVAPSCAIRQMWSLPKRIGEQERSAAAMEAHMAASAQRQETGERAIIAVRLFQEGAVTPVAAVSRVIDPPPGAGGGYEFVPIARPVFLPSDSYQLTAAQAPEFVRFWQWLDGVGDPVALAARRFSDAKDRRRAEDRILDLVIGAEALFGAGETQEVSYKVRLRAAAFLGDDAMSRRRIFQEFKKAYEARSMIAHGGKPTKEQKHQLDRLPGLIEVMERHIRAAIHKAAGLSLWPSSHAAWDEAVLDALEGRLTFS